MNVKRQQNSYHTNNTHYDHISDCNSNRLVDDACNMKAH